MTIHTAFGDGEIVEVDRGRMGKTRYKVAGFGFEVWLDESDPAIHMASNPRDRAGDSWAESRDKGWKEHERQDLDYLDEDPYGYHNDRPTSGRSDLYRSGATFDFEPTDHVWDNHTTLPYDWQPQFPVDMFRHEQTQSPDHEIDRDERTSPSDSRSGESRSPIHEYPGPSPKLFARRTAAPYEAPHAYSDESEAYDRVRAQHPEYGRHEKWMFDENEPLPLREKVRNVFNRSAAGWQPPLNPEHDPDFDEYEEDAFRPGFEPDYDQQAQDFARSQRMQDHNREWQDAYRAEQGEPHRHEDIWSPEEISELKARSNPESYTIPEHLQAKPGEPSWQDHVNADAARLQQELGADTSNPAHPDHLPPPRQGAWERPAGLSDKYAQILESADHHNDPVQRFRDDPHTAIQRHGAIDVSAGLDNGVGDEQLIYGSHDQILRTAAWRDVRKKATRLVREGRVDVHAMDSNAIYANVEGDHGTYEVMILNGSAYPNGGFNGGKRAIANWKCSCDWGKWAFKRQMTFVGRLCSHGYATYLTQQSHHLKNNTHHFRPKKKVAGVDEFKSWVNEENGGHVDLPAADNFLSIADKPVTPEEAQKIYDYVNDHVSEHPERDYDQDDGYSNDPDSAYKGDNLHHAEMLRHQPGKLTPHLYEVPDEHYHEFEDLGDDRKTTGPDQIQAKIAKGDEDVRPHHPAFAWHVDDQPDFPKDGIVHFSSLTHVADENLLQRLRDLSEEGPAEHPHHAEEHNHEVSQVVDELHDRGYAAAPLVAMKKRAMWKVAEPSESDELNALRGAEQSAGYTPPADAALNPNISNGAGNPVGGTVLGVPRSVAGPGPGGSGGQTPSAPPATAADVRPPGPGAAPGGVAGAGGGGAQGPHAPGASVPAPSTFQDGPGGTYTVKPGDNLTDIAQSHGVPLDSLEKANAGNTPLSGTDIGKNPDLIHPGDNLKLPAAGSGGGKQFGPPLPETGTIMGKPAGGNSGSTADYKSWYGTGGGGNASPPSDAESAGGGVSAKGLSAAGGGAPKGMTPGSGSTPGGDISKGMMPGGKIGAQQFARLYFQAADESGSGGSEDSGDSGEKEKVTSPSTNQGGNYKPVTSPSTPVNQPRADSSNPLGAPQAGSVSVSGPKGADSTTSAAPGQPEQKQQQQPGGMPGIGQGLSQALSVAEPLIQGIGGALGGLPVVGPAISGVTNALGGLGGMHLGAQEFAARYMHANGSFLDDDDNGPDWMDYPFAGSGPDRQDWSGTSEDYVKEHELPKRSETWMTDNDGDVVKYTDRPKQFKSRRHIADGGMLGGGDAGYGSTGGMAGGTLSPSGSGQGLGGSFTEAESSSAAPTMGTLTNTANVSESSRQFWADAFHPSEQGFFNPHLRPYQDYDKGDPDDTGGKPKGKGKGGDAADDAGDAAGVANEAAGIVEDAAPALLAASTNDHSDVVRRFQASGGGCLGGDSGGGFDDDAIAHQAQRMLRTAGRKFTPAEERELEMEAHVLGARNLGDLDLRGTHYLDD